MTTSHVVNVFRHPKTHNAVQFGEVTPGPMGPSTTGRNRIHCSLAT
jgi:hypothetical protein